MPTSEHGSGAAGADLGITLDGSERNFGKFGMKTNYAQNGAEVGIEQQFSQARLPKLA